MSAEYRNPRVEIDAATGVATADFEIHNSSSSAWSAAEGFAIGYHLFDADTGTLIVDGARIFPDHDVAPGGSTTVQMTFTLPPEDGRYQVFVSPMRENVCWYYEQGWPFLAVDTITSEGTHRLDSVRIATSAGLRRQRTLRSAGRALVYPVLTVWRNRGLIRVMVRRDILGRYRGSFGGSLWTVINPLLLMLTYYFVFGVVLRTPFPGDTSRTGFLLYFLAGMLPWLAFSEAVGRSPSVLMEHRNFVKKLVFAVETLPANLVISGLVNELFAIVLFGILVLVVRHGLPVTVLWLPILLIPQLMFTAGLAWFLAALGAFVRDLGQTISFVVTIWFFVTPICYSEESLPKSAAALISKNPIYILVRGYRAIFLENRAPAFGPLWKLWLLAAVVFVLGHAWFYKLRKSFADML